MHDKKNESGYGFCRKCKSMHNGMGKNCSTKKYQKRNDRKR